MNDYDAALVYLYARRDAALEARKAADMELKYTEAHILELKKAGKDLEAVVLCGFDGDDLPWRNRT